MASSIDMNKNIKSLLVITLSKAVVFITVAVFIIVSYQTEISSQNDALSQCSTYLEFKISHYQSKAHFSTLVLIVIGSFFSALHFGFFLFFYLGTKK